MSLLVIVPARGGSKGLPGKNIRQLYDHPLVSWPIKAALACPEVTRVIVSTDSKEIADVAMQYGADVPFLRPEYLGQDGTSTFDVIEHAIEYLKKNEGKQYDYCMVLEPTSPLTEAEDITSAYKQLVENRKKADAIVGVSANECGHPSFTVKVDGGLLKPFIGKTFQFLRRQEIEPLYFLDGTLYLSDTQVLLKEKIFYHNRTMPYVTPKWKSLEVDDLVDFVCVEAIMKNIENFRRK